MITPLLKSELDNYRYAHYDYIIKYDFDADTYYDILEKKESKDESETKS